MALCVCMRNAGVHGLGCGLVDVTAREGCCESARVCLREHEGHCESARVAARARGRHREREGCCESATAAANLSVISILREREGQKVEPYEGE